MRDFSPNQESARLRTLRRYEILDTAPEEGIEAIVRRSAAACDAPIAVFSLVAANRIWFKSRVGIDAVEINRTGSFCAHTIAIDTPLIVENAFEHPLFQDHPLVAGPPNFAFYAGVPIHADNGQPLGALCLMDTTPRAFPWEHYKQLTALALELEDEIEKCKPQSGQN